MTMAADAVFIDTNILIYATDDQSPFHEKALKMINRFMADGTECVISPQIVREYLVVLTRGMTPEDPARTAIFNNLEKLMETCTLLDENHETVANLQNIVESCAVTGKLIHDANIVAVMQANGIKRLATHNLDDFKKFKHWIEILALENV
ncbi:MAG: PIN domain-containing protein [Desulfosalsimonadaceae bacterium]